MSAHFTYVRLGLEWGRTGQQALDVRLKALGRVFADAGCHIVGRFAPQLGWAADEATVLIEGSGDVADQAAAIDELTLQTPVLRSSTVGLFPTARPAGPLALKAGGVYVHRWFTVDTPTLDEFVSLSAEAWPDFEDRFDAQIFGLFRAGQSESDTAAGHTRLLLLTRYSGHGVWEASRDPTTAAMQIFARRQLLTRHTIAASSLLVGA